MAPITSEQFREWRSPRQGRSNPERMNNPVWEWMIRTPLMSAYAATSEFAEPSAPIEGPTWCFNRYGQSTTNLVDGRVVRIGGEHEDFYDPDFYIYNDVVVHHPDDRIDIFCYPRGVFPPTDFHTATLSGNRIVIIGSLGYLEARKHETTQVMSLDLGSFAITPIVAAGTSPGWLSNHEALLSDEGASILIRGGRIDRGNKKSDLVENIDDWKLHIGDWRWERLTERRWPRWALRRKDRKHHSLFEIRQALWSRDDSTEKFERQMESLTATLGIRPNIDLIKELYRPKLPHELVPATKGEFRVHRVKMDGVVVRYVEDAFSVHLTVEGELSQETLRALTSDIQDKLAALENASWDVIPI